MHLEARIYAKELIKMKEEREIRIEEKTNEEICWNNNNYLNTDDYDMNSEETISKLEQLQKEKVWKSTRK
jgi:hypothetical protein